MLKIEAFKLRKRDAKTTELVAFLCQLISRDFGDDVFVIVFEIGPYGIYLE